MDGWIWPIVVWRLSQQTDNGRGSEWKLNGLVLCYQQGKQKKLSCCWLVHGCDVASCASSSTSGIRKSSVIRAPTVTIPYSTEYGTVQQSQSFPFLALSGRGGSVFATPFPSYRSISFFPVSFPAGNTNAAHFPSSYIRLYIRATCM